MTTTSSTLPSMAWSPKKPNSWSNTQRRRFPERQRMASSLPGVRRGTDRICRSHFVSLPDERVDVTLLRPEQVIEFQAGAKVLYVFHAMPMTAGQKRQYRKLKGRR